MKKVFKDLEEMKWYYHARYCKNPDDSTANIMMRLEYIKDVVDANQKLKSLGEPCEVKTK